MPSVPVSKRTQEGITAWQVGRILCIDWKMLIISKQFGMQGKRFLVFREHLLQREYSLLIVNVMILYLIGHVYKKYIREICRFQENGTRMFPLKMKL
jgi:hypothetical protein